GVQPHLVAVRADLVLLIPPPTHVPVAHQPPASVSSSEPSTRRHRGVSASRSAIRVSPASRVIRHICAPCGSRALSTLNSAITSPLSPGANPLPRNGARSITHPCIACVPASARPPYAIR